VSGLAVRQLSLKLVPARSHSMDAMTPTATRNSIVPKDTRNLGPALSCLVGVERVGEKNNRAKAN